MKKTIKNSPSIVFGIQQKVGANDGYADGNYGKYYEDKQHEACAERAERLEQMKNRMKIECVCKTIDHQP